MEFFLAKERKRDFTISHLRFGMFSLQIVQRYFQRQISFWHDILEEMCIDFVTWIGYFS
jgi:hypothetical protein